MPPTAGDEARSGMGENAPQPTQEDDLPSTAGDKVRSGLGEHAPETTQEGDMPPTAGDEVRSGIGESAPETTHGGDGPPQPTREPVPVRVTAAGFAAMLAAARAGPGISTQREAPPTATPPPQTPEVFDGYSPLRTRQGTIRGPPKSPKRRQPHNN